MGQRKQYKIWVDDIRSMPNDYDIHIKSVWEFIHIFYDQITGDDMMVVDLDHDSGDYEDMGGDYIQILRYLERIIDDGWIRKHIVFRIHTANPPAKQLMLNIIERNNWVYDNKIQ